MKKQTEQERCLIAALALGLDAGLGDPENRYHPVAWMGTAILKVKPYVPQGKLARLGFGTAVSLGGGQGSALALGRIGGENHRPVSLFAFNAIAGLFAEAGPVCPRAAAGGSRD